MASKDYQIKAIPTEYKGVQMKSRLEADVAMVLDWYQMEWQYEPTSFLLGNGQHYWPDFHVPTHSLYIEAKGTLEGYEKQKDCYECLCQQEECYVLCVGKSFVRGHCGDGSVVYATRVFHCDQCHKTDIIDPIPSTHDCRFCGAFHDVSELERDDDFDYQIFYVRDKIKDGFKSWCDTCDYFSNA